MKLRRQLSGTVRKEKDEQLKQISENVNLQLRQFLIQRCALNILDL